MRELLQLCAYKPEEIERELPRVKKSFEKLGIFSEDVEIGKGRIRDFFEIELEGVRKILGVYLRELVSLGLARDEHEKVIYTALPNLSGDLLAAAMVKEGASVYVGIPDLLLMLVLQVFFNKNIKHYEAAEKHAMSVGQAHCGCKQTHLGALLCNTIPKPDLHVGFAIYCDEAPKVDALYEELFNIPVSIVSRCQDIDWHDTEGTPERIVNYFAESMRRSVRDAEKVVGYGITDEMIGSCFMDTMGFFMDFVKLETMVCHSDPLPLSMTTLWYFYIMLSVIVRPENRARRKDALKTLIAETEERIKQGEGVTEKGAPRIILGAVPSMVDPSLDGLIRELGLSIPLAECQCSPPDADFMPKTGDPNTPMDPYVGLARLFLASPIVGNLSTRIPNLIKACKRYNIDGVILLLHYSCRPFATDALMVKDALKKELGIPVLVLEGDIYDPRYYTKEQLRTRIESFAELLKASRIS
jgi:benzoyl-CoA reductase/2-hydroxyglutaryl-CoA dehydratase subunit BcrC/BadD/HgdB